MTIVDTFLNEQAKAINGESFVVPTHLAVATTVVTAIATTDTDLSGEIGTREALSGSRVDNVTSLSAVRSGADVQDTANGDEIKSSGIFSAITSGELLSGVVHGGITQTTNFDIEFVYDITVNRGS